MHPHIVTLCQSRVDQRFSHGEVWPDFGPCQSSRQGDKSRRLGPSRCMQLVTSHRLKREMQLSESLVKISTQYFLRSSCGLFVESIDKFVNWLGPHRKNWHFNTFNIGFVSLCDGKGERMLWFGKFVLFLDVLRTGSVKQLNRKETEIQRQFFFRIRWDVARVTFVSQRGDWC